MNIALELYRYKTRVNLREIAVNLFLRAIKTDARNLKMKPCSSWIRVIQS
jgi:hypothetical protein